MKTHEYKVTVLHWDSDDTKHYQDVTCINKCKIVNWDVWAKKYVEDNNLAGVVIINIQYLGMRARIIKEKDWK